MPERATEIVRTPHLTREDLAKVDQLARRCRELEGLDLTLNTELAALVADSEPNQLVCREAGMIRGVLSLQPGEEIEACVLVDPGCRRRGIGRALLAAAREECLRRGLPGLILTCERASASGRAFVEAVKGRRGHAEHRLQLDHAGLPDLRVEDDGFRLDPAGIEEEPLLVRLIAAAFEDPELLVRERVRRWLSRPDQRFFIGSSGPEPVGCLRVFTPADLASINTFGVLPECRGRGFGRRILTATLHRLVGEGWRRVQIEVATENAAALHLYLSCGFRMQTTYDFYEVAADG